MSPQKKSIKNFGGDYSRSVLVKWITIALKNSSREEELTNLLELEAQATDEWLPLVEHLLELGELEEAGKAAELGLKRSDGTLSGIVSKLEEHLVELLSTQQRWEHVAAIREKQFVRAPGDDSFQAFLAVGEVLGKRDEFRSWAFEYLEHGVPERSGFAPELQLWEHHAQRSFRFPVYGALIQISIAEKNAEEVLHWYSAQKNASKFFSPRRDVASVLESKYPEEAIAIWKHLAEQGISQKSNRSYAEATRCLAQVKRIYTRIGKEQVWVDTLADVRTRHSRKTNLLRELKSLGNN